MDYTNKNTAIIKERMETKVNVQLLQFHPVYPQILFSIELIKKELIITNLDNNRMFTVSLNHEINTIQIAGDNLILATALDG